MNESLIYNFDLLITLRLLHKNLCALCTHTAKSDRDLDLQNSQNT